MVSVWGDDWDDPYPQPDGWRSHYKRLGGGDLGMGLYELLPGQTQCAYHFHHGNDEALLVLQGVAARGESVDDPPVGRRRRLLRPRRGERMNVYADDWDDPFPALEGWKSHVKRLLPPAPLGMSLYELLPGQTQCPYHFHHAEDELILVLRGRPTLRTPDAEQELDEGDVVHFPKGPDGAHQVVNRSGEPTRYVIASTNISPEVCEYPDSGKVLSASSGASTRGKRLWTMHRFDDGVDYFDGEEPRG